MLKKLTFQNWHAWINTMPVQPTFGTLYVAGDVVTHPSQTAILVRKVPQGINPTILMLDIIVQSSHVPTKQPQPLRYVEAVTSKNQYTIIEIFESGQKIETIDEIDVIS